MIIIMIIMIIVKKKKKKKKEEKKKGKKKNKCEYYCIAHTIDACGLAYLHYSDDSRLLRDINGF